MRIALLWFFIFVCFIFVEFNIKWLMTSHRMYSFLVVFLFFFVILCYFVFFFVDCSFLFFFVIVDCWRLEVFEMLAVLC